MKKQKRKCSARIRASLVIEFTNISRKYNVVPKPENVVFNNGYRLMIAHFLAVVVCSAIFISLPWLKYVLP